jgi:1,4-dihydroxy-2-naphthoyl-CoA synthase
MSYEQITAEQRGEVLVITMNRPERLNAWTPQMSREQVEAITAANNDASVGAIVLTGAGRGFCAGADTEAVFQNRINADESGAAAEANPNGMTGGVDWVQFLRSSKPIVAAVNGPAVGIGITMILPCDQIVASSNAKFGSGFIKMGLVPELASSRLYVQRLGWGKASDFVLSGRIISGTEAHEIGLADRVCEPEALLDTAVEVARSYAANPDLQLRMIKQLLTENSLETDLSLVQRREIAMLEQCYVSVEHKEAVAAFREKRPAVFRPQAG